MAPLVPEFISSELNLIIALLIGIGFGFVLEQAGFSSSRKLAGLFYGYDFVVLRVFFTAGVTAMIGLIVFSYLGWIDISRIYVNPTFLYSGIVGGLIMGAGFITGGFCPGTSVCAAATGKLDAMAFIVGIFLGVFAFSEMYPWLQDFYKGHNLGNLLIYQTLGISRGLFAFLMTFVAIAAFVVTTFIENRVNGRKVADFSKIKLRTVGLVGASVLIGFLMIFLPDLKTRSVARADSINAEQVFKSIDLMSVDELTMKLISRDRDIQVIDVRSTEAFKSSNIPTSVNIPQNSLANSEWRTVLRKHGVINVFYADTPEIAGRACLLSRYLGDSERSKVLETGFNDYSALMITPHQSGEVAGDSLHFRQRAVKELAILKDEVSRKPEVPKKPVKIQGGC